MVKDGDGAPGARPDHTLLTMTHREHWVAFYESFDRLVRETTTRSADLLRQAMVLPAIADREVAEARAEAARQLTEERGRQRAVLSVLQAELDGGRRRTELLAGSVAGLAALTADMLADVARLSQRVASALTELEAMPAPDAATTTEPAPARQATATRGWAWESDPVAGASPAAGDGEAGAAPAAGAESRIAANGDAEPAASPVPTTGETPRTVQLVVRGARPTSALSLQRYLATLDHVAGVEVRDYAADVLRIEVQVARPLTATDLQTWDTGAGLEIISMADDAIEVHLTDPLRSPKLLPPRERTSA